MLRFSRTTSTRVRRVGLLATAVLVASAVAAPVLGVVTPAAAAAAAAYAVTPSTGLVDGQPVSVVLTGASPGTVYVAVECDPTAFTLLGQGANAADACDQRHNAVLAVDAGGVAAGVVDVQAVMTTALGAADCRSVTCFVAIEAVHATGGPSLEVSDISFAASACAKKGSCTTAPDAWDPSLGGAPVTAAPTTSGTTAAARAGTRAAIRGGTATPGGPVTLPVTAGLAGDLTAADAVTGPYAAAFPAPDVPPTPTAGEGLLRLALSGPGTTWGGKKASSTVADVTLTDTTTGTVVGTQQMVLFDGKTTFVYAGVTGPVTTGDAYTVTVAAEPPAAAGGLSQPKATATPKVKVKDRQLEVVAPDNPMYLAEAYAPVMYGRSTSALHDVPLLVDATATPAGNGATTLGYTFIWSHEDAGTGFVPFLESSAWGRMTDIENAISFTVAADGTVSNASYLWGGEPATGFPDSQTALSETDQPFTGTWDGTHPVLRDATGNNDFSQSGTTPFRFQLAPVPGPAPGQTRESVMDAHPFTYAVSGQEVQRWYGDLSTDPASPNQGDAAQYATVDLDTAGTGVTSIAVQLQLSGGPTWYSSDFGTGYPSVGTGHVRTVVKLPTDWQTQTVTGVRLAVTPAAAAPSVTVSGLTVLAQEPDGTVADVSLPAPTVMADTTPVPVAVGVTAGKGSGQTVAPGKALKKLAATVTDQLGAPLAGVAVTFSTGSSGALFTSCGCSTEVDTTSAKGVATAGKVVAPSGAGTGTITAATPDGAAAPASFTFTVG